MRISDWSSDVCSSDLVTEERSRRPERQRVPAASGVIGAGSHVSSQQLRGKELHGPAVHLLTLARVDGVTDPPPLGVLDAAEVAPPAARAARRGLQSGDLALNPSPQQLDGAVLPQH